MPANQNKTAQPHSRHQARASSMRSYIIRPGDILACRHLAWLAACVTVSLALMVLAVLWAEHRISQVAKASEAAHAYMAGQTALATPSISTPTAAACVLQRDPALQSHYLLLSLCLEQPESSIAAQEAPHRKGAVQRPST